ncbi:hypothetical protein [Noviherbaspirillum aridicola]|uniref:Uncharacterized protein n=1 Tax=Noviherbaspirillum aridicola TaxID=2849687 RepID=A0ABQ4Q1M7_9BURK|nr:hypothetical protein [Noviherbaspirillum aridicola]GIZ51098.1 hypothetical protein NCCP691_11120 [Noviherbaspirillum aridicola]
MKKKNDQVFPTSLSEVAFVLVFLLMLLMGYMLFLESKEKTEARRRLAEAEAVKHPESVIAAMREASQELKGTLLAGSHGDPDQTISRLREAVQTRAERDALRLQLRELNDRFTALTALREQIAKEANSDGAKVTQEEIERALALQEQILKLAQGDQHGDDKHPDGAPSDESARQTQDRKAALERVRNAIAATNALHQEVRDKLGRKIKPGTESEAVRQLVDGGRESEQLARSQTNPTDLKRENTDLRGQLAYLTRQLNRKGGVDHPPCWPDENGKIEFLINVETRPDGYVVSKAWLPHREQEARSLPGLEQAISSGFLTPANFAAAMQPILNWSKKQDPQCRHFVHLTTTIADGNARDRARRQVEGFFYKREASQ